MIYPGNTFLLGDTLGLKANHWSGDNSGGDLMVIYSLPHQSTMDLVRPARVVPLFLCSLHLLLSAAINTPDLISTTTNPTGFNMSSHTMPPLQVPFPFPPPLLPDQLLNILIGHYTLPLIEPAQSRTVQQGALCDHLRRIHRLHLHLKFMEANEGLFKETNWEQQVVTLPNDPRHLTAGEVAGALGWVLGTLDNKLSHVKQS